MRTNKQKEIIGITAVSQAVVVEWNCDWQEYSHINDEGIDGIILMRRGQKASKATGGVVFVQIKCGGNGYRQDQVQHPNHICINLGREYIEKHRPRWNRMPGPAILIFVDDTIDHKNPPCWWVDVKSDNSYSTTNKSQILIPKNQKFGSHSKGIFHQLCGTGPTDRLLPTITLTRAQDIKINLSKTESLRNDAWEYYKDWRGCLSDRSNPALGEIFVNRTGWKHITRFGRRSERIVQSWLLLAAARQVVKSVSDIDFLRHGETVTLEDGTTRVIDYLGLRANVKFTYRHESVVQVVLKRIRIINATFGQKEREKIWFYSVYELRRGIK